MAITLQRSSDYGAERYKYDFSLCTYERGWAQVDTSQDASYYGNWINPEKRLLFSYCEGDTCLTKCDTDAELVAEVTKMRDWNFKQGHRFMGIDPGYSDLMKQRLRAAGLGAFMH